MSKVIATSLGLAEDADEKTILAALAERDEKVTTAEKTATEAAEKLAVTQGELDALKATASDADKRVADLTTQVAALAKASHESKRDAILDKAILDTKMLPAEREAMTTIADTAGIDVVKQLLESRQPTPLSEGKGSGGDAPPAGRSERYIDDTPVDPVSVELDAKVQAHLLSLNLGRTATDAEYLAAAEHVLGLVSA